MVGDASVVGLSGEEGVCDADECLLVFDVWV